MVSCLNLQALTTLESMEKNPNATKIAETTGGGASYFITEGVLG
jgi:hypothetical protein